MLSVYFVTKEGTACLAYPWYELGGSLQIDWRTLFWLNAIKLLSAAQTWPYPMLWVDSEDKELYVVVLVNV